MEERKPSRWPVQSTRELKEIFLYRSKKKEIIFIAKNLVRRLKIERMNDLPTAAINLKPIVAKDEIAISTNAVAVSALK
jgi:hypothetical protein